MIRTSALKNHATIFFLLVAAAVDYGAIRDTTIVLNDNQSEGSIRIINSANNHNLATSDSIYDSVSFGSSFSLTIFNEPNSCLCEQGIVIPEWLRFHQALNTGSVAYQKHGSIVSDTNWANALRFPDSTTSLDTTCANCADIVGFRGIVLATDSTLGLSTIMPTNFLIPSKTIRAIIYVRDTSGRIFKLQCTSYEVFQPLPVSYKSFKFFTIRWAVAPKGSDRFDATRITLSSRVGTASVSHSKQAQAFDLQGRKIDCGIQGLALLRLNNNVPARLTFKYGNEGR